MLSQNNNFKLSREESAQKLGISLRTLDRHLKTGKLPHVKVEDADGQTRILISADAVEEISQRKRGVGSKARVAQESHSEAKNETTSAQNQVASQNNAVAEVYRNLYEETNRRLSEASRRLEGANYRVGELEAQIKASVPLLEYREAQEKTQKLTQKVEKLNQEVAEGAIVNYRLTEEITETRRNFDLEKNKRILYITLLVIFVILGSFGLFWQNLA